MPKFARDPLTGPSDDRRHISAAIRAAQGWTLCSRPPRTHGFRPYRTTMTVGAPVGAVVHW